MLILILVYLYARYAFASMTAQITAMYVPFLSVAATAGAPPLLASLSLGFLSQLSGRLISFRGRGRTHILRRRIRVADRMVEERLHHLGGEPGNLHRHRGQVFGGSHRIVVGDFFARALAATS